MVTERNPGYWRQLDTMPNSTWKDIGSRDFIKDYDELIWYPAEVDVSIRPSWGYVEGEEKQLYSLETLLYMYEKAVGGNATLLLNVPPNKEGLFDLEDVERLAGAWQSDSWFVFQTTDNRGKSLSEEWK